VRVQFYMLMIIFRLQSKNTEWRCKGTVRVQKYTAGMQFKYWISIAFCCKHKKGFVCLISFIPNKLRPEFISFLNSLFFTWIAEINWCMHYLHIRNLSWYFTCSCVYVTRLNIPITEQGLVKIGDAKPEYLQCIYNTRVNAMHPLYIKREYKLLQLVHIQYPTTRLLAALYPQAKIPDYPLNTRTVPKG